MSEYQKHALWLRPFGDIAYDIKERIHELSEEYNTPSFEPHITLLSDMRDKKAKLLQFTDTLAASLEPFTIQLTTLGYHDDYYQAFFANIKKTDDLVVAQQTAQKFFSCTTDEAYFPHLSLMYGDIPENIKQDLLSTMGPSLYLSFPVHSLLLIKTEGEVNEWEKIHTAEFHHSL